MNKENLMANQPWVYDLCQLLESTSSRGALPQPLHTEMSSGFKADSYLGLIDSWITQLKARGPSRTCNESEEEEKRPGAVGSGLRVRSQGAG